MDTSAFGDQYKEKLAQNRQLELIFHKKQYITSHDKYQWQLFYTAYMQCGNSSQMEYYASISKGNPVNVTISLTIP